MKYLWEKIVSLAGSNFGLKILAVVIAVGLWVAGHRDVERAVEVPVEFRNIPSDLMVVDNRVDYVVLRLTGPRTLVSTLDAEDGNNPEIDAVLPAELPDHLNHGLSLSSRHTKADCVGDTNDLASFFYIVNANNLSPPPGQR